MTDIGAHSSDVFASEMINSEKATLRRLLRLRRRDFAAATGPAQLHLHAIIMARIVLAQLGEARSIAGYVAAGYEVDPLPILELAHAKGLQIALPFIDRRGGSMRFLHWHPGARLVEGPYGILQPLARAQEIAPDVILTPLVGFDRAGHRLGQGGGFYDRAFARLPHARRIGMGWAVQQARRLPVDPWDQSLHGVATEREWIDCT